MPVSNREDFSKRQIFSAWETNRCIEAAYGNRELLGAELFSLEEDIEKAKDHRLWLPERVQRELGLPSNEARTQSKLRVRPKYRECPVIVWQPWRGRNHPDGNVIGRDYKGLMVVKETDLYMVGMLEKVDGLYLYTELHLIDTATLRLLVAGLQNSWESIPEWLEDDEYGPYKNSRYRHKIEFLSATQCRSLLVGRDSMFLWDDEEYGQVVLLRDPKGFFKINFLIPRRYFKSVLHIPVEAAKRIRLGITEFRKKWEDSKEGSEFRKQLKEEAETLRLTDGLTSDIFRN